MADILIKNIEMPKEDDLLKIAIDSDGNIGILEPMGYKRIGTIAIELPPHGRLGDLDAILAQEKPRGIADDVWEESNFFKVIDTAPVIVEAST